MALGECEKYHAQTLTQTNCNTNITSPQLPPNNQRASRNFSDDFSRARALTFSTIKLNRYTIFMLMHKNISDKNMRNFDVS